MSSARPIWITGASGLLGSNLTLEFAARGLLVLPISGTHSIHPADIPSSACDLTNSSAVAQLFVQHPPAVIIHCAAATNIDWCESHPDEAMHINAQGAGDLAARAFASGAGFVHISTDAIFDGLTGGYIESSPPHPLNVYARTKLAGEQTVLRAHPNALILRVNIFGWNLQPKFSLAEWVLDRLERNESVPGFRDVIFAPVLVNHLAPWILHLCNSGATGVFHVASSDHMSKFDFARLVAEVFGLDKSLVAHSSLADSSLAAPRPRNLWLCTVKLASALGHSLPTIRQGLEQFRVLRETGFVQRLKSASSQAFPQPH